MPGAYNAATAMLIKEAGFKAVYISGAGLANSCGLPDTGLLSLEETVLLSSYITAAVDCPTLVDVDTGFGGPLSVKKTVRAFEAIGAGAVQIEDQEFPKRCGHLDNKRVVPAREFAKKIKAAVASRNNTDFLIVARTDSRAGEGMDAAVERALIYLDAGADMIFPEALLDKREFTQFATAIKAPLVANMTEFGKTPYITADEFAGIGYNIVLFPMTCFRLAMRSVETALGELKAKGTQKRLLNKMQTREALYKLLGYSPDGGAKKK
ncbi:MAG: methylisocitrate lyase [Deltaproteobacteria bacterium RIFCSPLOWO2_02_FULL_53_8]|nr:MAG: methylisocitrate lyase [Deltaproteobacteria bacterium RIFCSPLOWO2_02_FULL_53_8]